uniref:Si:dkeyp-94b4.1 n=2 Tax=Iconisemion striatum TaxID=60296 RepID=A0A1A7WBY4_9TELE
MVSLPFFGNRLSTDIGTKLRTNDQICGLIADKIAKFRASSMAQTGEGSLLQADRNMPQSGELHQTSTSSMDQQHLNFAELNPKPKEKGCLQIQPLAKSREKGLFPSDISAMTWDKVPKKCPSSTLSWNSPQKVHKPQLHGKEELDEQDVGIDDSTGVGSSDITKNSEDQQHCNFVCEGHVHSSKQSLNQSSSFLVDTGEEFEHQSNPKCDGERDFGGQISSYFGLEDEVESQPDDEDDNWEVIPLNIDNLRFEQTEYKPNSENIPQNKRDEVSRSTKAVPASAFLKMEVFETPDEQKQTVKFGQLSYADPSCRCRHESFKQRKDSSSEHEDCCETDDSADYSPDAEVNYMTVSKEFMKSFSAPVKPKTDDCGYEKNNYEVANFQKGQAWMRVQSSQEESIIIIDSDSESDTDCVEKQERDKICPLSENSRAEHKRSSPETMKTFQKTCLPVDQQHHVNPNLTQVTEKCRLNQSEKCTQTVPNDDHIIILSDSDDDDYRGNFNRAKESMDSGNSEIAKNALQNEEPLADFPKPRHDHTSEQEKLKINTEVMPANCNFLESKRKANVSKEKRKVVSPERRDDNALHIARSGLSAERKKVKTTVNSPRSNQKSVCLSEPVTPLGDDPMNIQTSHLNQDEGGSSSDRSKATSTNDSITSKLRRLIRDKKNNKTKPAGVYNAAAKSDEGSLQPRIRAPLKSSMSYSPFAPQNMTTSSTSTKSVQGTSHARTKVLSDWQKQHVPLRRERKFYKGAKHLRRTL